jgi:hypothetical protein
MRTSKKTQLLSGAQLLITVLLSMWIGFLIPVFCYSCSEVIKSLMNHSHGLYGVNSFYIYLLLGRVFFYYKAVIDEKSGHHFKEIRRLKEYLNVCAIFNTNMAYIQKILISDKELLQNAIQFLQKEKMLLLSNSLPLTPLLPTNSFVTRLEEIEHPFQRTYYSFWQKSFYYFQEIANSLVWGVADIALKILVVILSTFHTIEVMKGESLDGLTCLGIIVTVAMGAALYHLRIFKSCSFLNDECSYLYM